MKKKMYIKDLASFDTDNGAWCIRKVFCVIGFGSMKGECQVDTWRKNLAVNQETFRK